MSSRPCFLAYIRPCLFPLYSIYLSSSLLLCPLPLLTSTLANHSLPNIIFLPPFHYTLFSPFLIT
uniref:Uncharacterized protein n=1 Tax=Octopus bimaculoides TaxID=37653 RepID=A0A0L8G629_OCTBM